MRMVLAAVLILHGLAAFAFAVQSEVPISPAELLPVPSYSVDDFHLATNGEIYVAVWFDRRSSPVATYAARLRPDGTLLDRVGIRVGEGGDAGAVVWTGSAFLIAYLDGGVEGGTVKARTLTPDGILGEAFPLFTTERPASDFRMRLASNGESVLLVTNESNGALLDVDGRKLRDMDFGWTFGGSFSVGAAGSTYLVVASRHDGDLKTRIVTAEGELGASHVLMDTVRGGSAVASDGNRFLVSWARGNLYAQFLTVDGTPVDQPIPLTNLPNVHAGSHFVSRLLRRGNEYVLLYRREAAPHETLRLGNDAAKLGPLFTDPLVPVGEVVTQDGAGAGAVLGITEQSGLTAAFFDAGAPAALRNPTPVTFAGRHQSLVRLARVQGGFAAAWRSDGIGEPELYLSRGPGSAPVLVTREYAVLIDVVFESGALWVVWVRPSDDGEAGVYTRRYTPALQSIDAQPILVTDESPLADFAVAAGGGVVVVARNHPHDSYAEPAGPHIEAHILRATAGGVTVENVGIASRTGLDRLPAVEWDGSAFLIAWANATAPSYFGAGGIAANDRDDGTRPDDRILARRMNTAGQLLGPVIEVAVTRRVDALELANGIAVWQTYQAPVLSLKRHTYAARVAANAAVADLGGEDTLFGAVAPDDGGGFLLTRAKRIDAMTVAPELVQAGPDLAIARSVALAPIPVNVFFDYDNPYDADVIGGPMRMLGYARVAGAEYGHQQRIVVRRIAETARRRGVRITQQ